jgi:hypothetical protein
MSLILSGTDGLSDIDGTAATPAIRGTDANTGIFFGSDIIGFSEGGTECARFDASANFQFNSGYGSVATAYGCRAWVNFNGTTNTGGFCTIRASGNVTTVADNGTGDYTVNFTNAMPDANYSAVGNVTAGKFLGMDTLLVGSIQIGSRDVANAPSDQSNVLVAVFR